MADEIRKGLKEVASLIVATNKKLDEANDTALADTSTEISKSVTENTTAINDLSTNLAESTKNTRSVTENITTSAFRAFSSDQDSVRKLQKEEIDERKRANEELKQKIEEQGGLAKDNSKYVKESYEIQKEEFKLRKRNPNLSRAAQSEIDDEAKKAAKENRKTGGLMQKMAGSVLNSAKNVGKTALMGLFGIASVLGLGAFLIALSLFMNSPYWGKTVKWIEGTLIPNLLNFYKLLTENLDEILTALTLAVGGVALFGVLSAVGLLATAFGLLAANIIVMGSRMLGMLGIKTPVAMKTGTIGSGVNAKNVVMNNKGDWVYEKGKMKGQAVPKGELSKITGTKSAAGLGNFLDKHKTLKALIKKVPYIGAVLGTYEAYQIWGNDDLTDEQKAVGLGGLVGSLLGAAGFGIIGAMIGTTIGPLGTLAGGIAGMIGGSFAGDVIGQHFMKKLMGIETDHFAGEPKPMDTSINSPGRRGQTPEDANLIAALDAAESRNMGPGVGAHQSKMNAQRMTQGHLPPMISPFRHLPPRAPVLNSGVRANISGFSAVESANIRAATDSRAVTAKMLVDAHNLLTDAKKGMSITNISQNLNSIAADNSINQGSNQYPLAYTIYGNLNNGHPYMQR
jgi:outer membrane lipoprotein SlyB